MLRVLNRGRVCARVVRATREACAAVVLAGMAALRVLLYIYTRLHACPCNSFLLCNSSPFYACPPPNPPPPHIMPPCLTLSQPARVVASAFVGNLLEWWRSNPLHAFMH